MGWIRSNAINSLNKRAAKVQPNGQSKYKTVCNLLVKQSEHPYTNS